MSTLTSETKEVWVVLLHLPGDNAICELAEYGYDCKEDALARAHEELNEYIEKTGCDGYCTLEHRVVPIYK
jgi:hypothetical protein